MSRSIRKNIIAMTILLGLFLPLQLARAQVAWVKDFNSALKKAAREEKFVVVDFSASW
jgi:hypothetical protein